MPAAKNVNARKEDTAKGPVSAFLDWYRYNKVEYGQFHIVDVR